MKRGRPPLDEPRCKFVKVRLTPSEHLRLIALCDEEDRSMSYVVRSLIRKAAH